MSSAPWDEEKSGNRAAGMLFQGVLTVITGGVALGFGASIFGELETLKGMAGAWAAGGASSSEFAVTALTLAVACAGVSIVAGLVGVGSFFMKKRVVAAISFFLLVIASGVEISGAVVYRGLMSRSEAILVPEGELDDEERALNDFAAVVHRRCCYEVFSNSTDPVIKKVMENTQVPVPECPDTPKDCVASLDPTISGLLGELSSDLCTCFTNSVFSKIDNYVNKEGTCKLMENARVNISPDLDIPTTTIDLNTAIVSLDEPDKPYKQYTPIPSLGMAGQIAPRDPPSVNGEFSPPDQGEVGFGCGLGYVKGVAWVQSLYIASVGGTATIVLMVCGGVQILSVLFVLGFWAMGGGSNDDTFIDYEGGAVTPKQQF